MSRATKDNQDETSDQEDTSFHHVSSLQVARRLFTKFSILLIQSVPNKSVKEIMFRIALSIKKFSPFSLPPSPLHNLSLVFLVLFVLALWRWGL
jgi:hypothetical protein